jgi:hypothetical protein
MYGIRKARSGAVAIRMGAAASYPVYTPFLEQPLTTDSQMATNIND